MNTYLMRKLHVFVVGHFCGYHGNEHWFSSWFFFSFQPNITSIVLHSGSNPENRKVETYFSIWLHSADTLDQFRDFLFLFLLCVHDFDDIDVEKRINYAVSMNMKT